MNSVCLDYKSFQADGKTQGRVLKLWQIGEWSYRRTEWRLPICATAPVAALPQLNFLQVQRTLLKLPHLASFPECVFVYMDCLRAFVVETENDQLAPQPTSADAFSSWILTKISKNVPILNLVILEMATMCWVDDRMRWWEIS